MPACPIIRGKCTTCGGQAKRSIHPHKPDLYPWEHAYPWDDMNDDHPVTPDGQGKA